MTIEIDLVNVAQVFLIMCGACLIITDVVLTPKSNRKLENKLFSVLVWTFGVAVIFISLNITANWIVIT